MGLWDGTMQGTSLPAWERSGGISRARTSRCCPRLLCPWGAQAGREGELRGAPSCAHLLIPLWGLVHSVSG